MKKIIIKTNDYEHPTTYHPNDMFLTSMTRDQIDSFYRINDLETWNDTVKWFFNTYNCSIIYVYHKSSYYKRVSRFGFRFNSLEDKTEFFLKWMI